MSARTVTCSHCHRLNWVSHNACARVEVAHRATYVGMRQLRRQWNEVTRRNLTHNDSSLFKREIFGLSYLLLFYCCDKAPTLTESNIKKTGFVLSHRSRGTDPISVVRKGVAKGRLSTAAGSWRGPFSIHTGSGLETTGSRKSQ